MITEPVHLDGNGRRLTLVGDGFFGTIAGLDEAIYHATSRLSAHGSALILGRCPSIYKYRQDHPKPPTRALEDGKIFHALLLEPTKATAIYTPLYEGFDGRTKDGKAAMAEISAAGRSPVPYETWGRLTAMAAAVRRHPMLGGVFGAGQEELSLFWQDDLWATHVPLKARPDWLPKEGRLILDVKTSDGASPGDLERDMVNYGYHYQAAQYEEGALKLGLRDDPKFVMVVVEKEPPYEVVIARPSDEAITLARGKLGDARRIYAKCQETGLWPGYTDDVIELGLPGWVRRAEGL
ncbi:MAG: PD-(D/E)XK nuclease-like domain-containing protein [Patescibacteria group bacterium]|nr:PD-(D/E)XK nuclease-like domain-containing protein [Patescibacteria group bacterium]